MAQRANNVSRFYRSDIDDDDHVDYVVAQFVKDGIILILLAPTERYIDVVSDSLAATPDGIILRLLAPIIMLIVSSNCACDSLRSGHANLNNHGPSVMGHQRLECIRYI